MSIAEYWDDLVTTALLGTDRRASTAAGRLGRPGRHTAAPAPTLRCAAGPGGRHRAVRAGVLPGPTVAPLAPPAADPRPVAPRRQPGLERPWRSGGAGDRGCWPWCRRAAACRRSQCPLWLTVATGAHARCWWPLPLGQWMVEWCGAPLHRHAPMPEAELLERMAGLPSCRSCPGHVVQPGRACRRRHHG